MPVKEEVLSANEQYARRFQTGDLPMPPARRFIVVTCMDARIEPAAALGIREGDAHVVRNAGGLVSEDALRSLVISHHLLGTQEALVIGHTDCGMLTFTNDELRGRLGPDADGVDFLPFSNVEERVRESLRAIRESPLLPESFSATGFVYDVRTGRLKEV
jgi:carbonic anhydrase